MSPPPRPAVQVHPLPLEDAPAAGGLLARAFVDNPGMRVVISHLDDAARLRALVGVKTGFARASTRFGEARGAYVDGKLGGAALSFPPGTYPPSLRTFAAIASGCLQPALVRAVPRFLRINHWMEQRHEKAPHFYLMVLGVDPDLQGKGIGGALLRELNDRADRAGVALYLEADKESNVSLYRRFGYEVVCDERLAALEDLRMWTMRRPAAAR